MNRYKPGCTVSHRRLLETTFRIKELKGLYYLCSENTDADELRACRASDLRHMQKAGFPMMRLHSLYQRGFLR